MAAAGAAAMAARRAGKEGMALLDAMEEAEREYEAREEAGECKGEGHGDEGEQRVRTRERSRRGDHGRAAWALWRRAGQRPEAGGVALGEGCTLGGGRIALVINIRSSRAQTSLWICDRHARRWWPRQLLPVTWLLLYVGARVGGAYQLWFTPASPHLPAQSRACLHPQPARAQAPARRRVPRGDS